MALAIALNANAIDKNTVNIVYNGTTATVTVASNISSYVTVTSGTSSHVKIVQSADFAGVDANSDNEDGEIIYSLSGTSTDGEFYMEPQRTNPWEANHPSHGVGAQHLFPSDFWEGLSHARCWLQPRIRCPKIS